MIFLHCLIHLYNKKQISSEVQNQILNKLNNEKDIFILYSKKDLAASVRRFISRYLIGKTQTIDLKEDRDLVFELSREDLWEEKIRKNDNLLDIIEKQIKEFKLTICQAYSFYELIGNDDKKSIQAINELI